MMILDLWLSCVGNLDSEVLKEKQELRSWVFISN